MIANVPEYSFYAMGGVIGVLVVATIIQFLLPLKNPDKDYSELRQRITSWWWIIGLLFVFLAVGGNAAIVFFAFISLFRYICFYFSP